MIANFTQPRSQWLYEGSVNDRSGWASHLECSVEEVETLLVENVLQRSSRGKGTLRLNLVGLLQTRNAVFFSFPKIFYGTEFDPHEQVHDVIRVIERYHSKVGRSNASSTADPAELHLEGRGIVDHFLGLINWTREYGFHSKLESYHSEYGLIDWRRTLSSQLAVHQGQNVTYIDPVRTRYEEVPTIIAAIQATAIVDLFNRIGSNIASVWIGDNDPIIEECAEILSNLELKLDRSVAHEALHDFNDNITQDHERSLGQLLDRWQTDQWQSGAHIQVYGFTAFHTVWEDICKSLWATGASQLTHSEFASQPEYRLKDVRIAVPPQRPDLIVATEQGIIIADAKWYLADQGEVPALHDVIKQFAYGLSVQKELKVARNLFLVPSCEAIECEDLGTVAMNFESKLDERFPPISVFRVGWKYAVARYVTSSTRDSLQCYAAQFPLAT